MEDLSYLTKAIRLQVQRDYALLLAERGFDRTKPARFIRGVAVSSSQKNKNGNAVQTMGLTTVLPAPLLIGHDYSNVIGLLTGLDVRGGPQVYFTAEIFNAERMDASFQAWAALIEQRLTCVSVGVRNLDPKPCEQALTSWTIDELSLCESGVDAGAKILRVYEKKRTVSLRGSDETVFWSAQ
jgi:hypothetical protein